jgi:hypothetical protein
MGLFVLSSLSLSRFLRSWQLQLKCNYHMCVLQTPNVTFVTSIKETQTASASKRDLSILQCKASFLIKGAMLSNHRRQCYLL